MAADNQLRLLMDDLAKPHSVFMVVVLTRCRPTKDISIEFEIRSKSVVLCFEMYSADDNGIFH